MNVNELIELEALSCECDGMKAENAYREHRGESQAYTEVQFFELAREMRALKSPVVESVTKAPEGKRACKRCGGSGYVENTVNPLSDEMTCPDCNDIPVDDSLAKAIHEHAVGDGPFDTKKCRDAYSKACQYYSRAVDNLKSAIRERDEKLSQMMTVEEFDDWTHHLWPPYTASNICSDLRRKIKERNEARK